LLRNERIITERRRWKEKGVEDNSGKNLRYLGGAGKKSKLRTEERYKTKTFQQIGSFFSNNFPKGDTIDSG